MIKDIRMNNFLKACLEKTRADLPVQPLSTIAEKTKTKYFHPVASLSHTFCAVLHFSTDLNGLTPIRRVNKVPYI